KVPPAPRSHDGQAVYLFHAFAIPVNAFGVPGGIGTKDLLQPVLQWGKNEAGGGENWAITCWYIDLSGHAFHRDLVRVNEGDILVGVIELTGQSGGMFNYNCYFQGFGATALPVQSIPEQTVASETLECYNIKKCIDYPNAYYTAMRSIELKAGGQDITPRWT